MRCLSMSLTKSPSCKMQAVYYQKLVGNLLVVSVAAASVGLLTSAVLAPILNSLSFPAGEPYYNFLANICHQNFYKVFFIFGHPTGLCARCCGGYLGIILGTTFVYYFQRKSHSTITNLTFYSLGTTFLILAIIEALIELGDQNPMRFLSGLMGGVGTGLALASLTAIIFTIAGGRCKTKDLFCWS